MADAEYRKSTFSIPSGACVEVAELDAGLVAVRDSKHPTFPPLIFRPDEWAAFLAGVKAGEFD